MNLFFLCMKIFFARILDVTIGTIRVHVQLQEKCFLSSVLAFFETLIWFLVAREALTIHVTSFLIPISYSLGYASGTLIGGEFARRFLPGIISVQAIIDESHERIIQELLKKGYQVSVLELKNNFDGNLRMMLYLEIQRKTFPRIQKIIRRYDPHAFIAVSETKKVLNGKLK